MKLLITGATGMVGKNLTENAGINRYELLTPSSSELNLLDFVATKAYVADKAPDMIIHCAGKVGGIQANMAEPVDFLVQNLDMGRNIIMAAKETGVKKLINMSSSCMYPRNAQNPLKEELVLKGELEPTNEGYALAKIAAMKLCEYIVREDESFQYKTLIPCNLYGRWDKFDPKHSHMLPAVIKKIHEAKVDQQDEVEIWGDGTARREFMYAGDLADFVAKAIENFEDVPALINVGLGHDYTINEYYEAIAKVIGFEGKFVHDLSKPVGMKQKLIDDSRLKQFGWSYTTSLEDGIRKTYEFYLENK